MSVQKDNVIQAFGWFKGLLDADIRQQLATIQGGDSNVIEAFALDGTIIPPDANKTVNLSLSSYATKADVAGALSLAINSLSSGDKNVIEAISVDGTIQPVTNKTAELNLSAYATKTYVTNALSSISSLSSGGGDDNVIEAISVDGTIQPIVNKTAILGLSAYAKKTEVASGLRMKGSVNSSADLPTNAVVGDLYNIQTAGGTDGNGTAIKAGDNVAYTDGGTWDVMAGFIDTSDFVRINTFNSALSSINSLSMAINGLSNYDLPTASTTTKGGVMIGTGLSMTGDTLNVTLDSGGTYTDFTGATSITGGASGLVPAPIKGDQEKFLRGDGSWARLNLVVNGGGSAITLASDTAATQGALWQDFFTDSVGNKTPVLKLRYGDYEYNFHYDTSKQLASTAPALVTDVGVQYNLSTLPSSEEGGLWYEVADTVPTLFMHKSVFTYGYNYDTITYKGTNANLYSYLPLESSFADALGNNWTVAATAKIEQAPWGGNALRNTGGMTLAVAKAYNMFTLDFWLYADLSRFPADTKTAYNILQITAPSPGLSKNVTLPLFIKNKTLTVSLGNKTDTFDLPSGERTHIALVHNAGARCGLFINGKQVATVLGQYALQATDTIKIFSTATNDYPAYIDHLRIFKNQILWDSDFEVPKPEDYLK